MGISEEAECPICRHSRREHENTYGCLAPDHDNATVPCACEWWTSVRGPAQNDVYRWLDR